MPSAYCPMYNKGTKEQNNKRTNQHVIRGTKTLIEKLRQSPLECDKFWLEAYDARLALETKLKRAEDIEVTLGEMSVTRRNENNSIIGYDVFRWDDKGRPINLRRLNEMHIFKEGYWFKYQNIYEVDSVLHPKLNPDLVWQYGTLDCWGRRIEMNNSEAFGVQVSRSAADDVTPVMLTNLNDRDMAMTTYLTAMSRRISIAGGHIVEEFYLDKDDNPTKNGDGVYGTRFEHNAKGLKVKETFLDQDGNVMEDRDGDAYSIYHYDKKNRLTLWYDQNIKGELAPDHWGVWWYVTRFGRDRRTETVQCLDKDKNLMNNGWGYAQTVTVVDEFGRRFQHYMLDKDGKRVKWNDGSYGERIEYDDVNRLQVFFATGPNGEPMQADSYQSRMVRYDDEHDMVEYYNLDADNKPMHSAKDDATTLMRFDPWGRITVQIGLDADAREVVEDCYKVFYEDDPYSVTYLYIDKFEAPARNSGLGYYAIRKMQDVDGRIILEEYLDNQLQPMEQRDGVCAIAIDYDDDKGTRTIRCMDEDHQFCMNSNGFATAVTQTESDGGKRSWRTDLDGNKVPFEEGYTSILTCYDSNDRERLVMYYDAEGKPFRDQMGVCGYNITYDNTGAEVKTYLNEEGQPTTDVEGTCTVSTEYDEQGRMTYICWFDEEGKPSGTMEGFYGKSMSYDEDGMLHREMFYDEFRQPVANRQGDYGVEYWWPTPGETVYVSLDKDGNPHPNNDGYTYRRRVLDEKGRDKQHRFYGLNFKPFMDKKGDCGVEFILDDDGKMLGWASLDAFGNRHLNNNGFAVEMGTSDDKGRPLEQHWQDLSGKPARDPIGDYGVHHVYDDNEHSEIRTSLGQDYQPHDNDRGFTSQKIWYDNKERTIKYAFMDRYGNPAANEDGNSFEVIHYFSEDESHREKACYDAYGNLRTCDEGYAFLEISDDEKGRRILQMYYDEEHRPCTNPDGAYGMMIDYDEEHGVELWSDLDDCGLPKVSELGVAYSERVFDDRERPLKVRFLNHKRQPVQDKNGCEAYTYQYQRGTRIVTCCDSEFRPKMCNKGYAKCVQMNDASGETKRLYLDQNGFWVDIYDDDELD